MLEGAALAVAEAEPFKGAEFIAVLCSSAMSPVASRRLCKARVKWRRQKEWQC